MKKILVTTLAAALAGGAWGVAVNSVQSANQFGAIKVTGSAMTMYVAVPFEGFDDKAVAASNVIHAAGLSDSTIMYVWNAELGIYDEYETDNGKWTAPPVNVVSGETTTSRQADLSTGVAVGTGGLLERDDITEPVYVYGQIPMTAVSSPTFEQGKTLVCIPSTNGED